MQIAYKTILIFALLVLLCGCGKTETEEQIVFPPSGRISETVNGYKMPEANNTQTASENNPSQIKYIANTSTKKFHLTDCRYVVNMKEDFRKEAADKEALLREGYAACKACNP